MQLSYVEISNVWIFALFLEMKSLNLCKKLINLKSLQIT